MPAFRKTLLVAHACACLPLESLSVPPPPHALQLEEAVELFMFAGRPRQALRILAQRLSDAVEGAAADASRGRGTGRPCLIRSC